MKYFLLVTLSFLFVFSVVAVSCTRSNSFGQSDESTTTEAPAARPAESTPPEMPETYTAMSWHLVSTTDDGGQATPTWYDQDLLPLEPEALITSENVASVRQVELPDGRPGLIIQLDEEGTLAFEQVTRENINRQLALVIGERAVHAPRIREAIDGGAIQVSACSGLGIPEMYRMITEGNVSSASQEQETN